MKYKAVDRVMLVKYLGRNCSPDRRNKATWYVIGPDINGRLSHCSTCIGGQWAAKIKANQMNGVKL
jgi:hypothetical protein